MGPANGASSRHEFNINWFHRCRCWSTWKIKSVKLNENEIRTEQESMANWLILTDGARRLMWSHEKSGDGHSPAARINGRKKRKNIGKQRMKINWMRPSSAEKAHRAGQVIECLRKECVQTCFSNPSHRWRVARPAGWVLLLPAYSLNMRLASYLFFFYEIHIFWFTSNFMLPFQCMHNDVVG